MKSRSVDVAIVGAGTAGLAALREVRRQTDSFVLINDGPYGTTCARVGCMPSKALIAVANAFHERRKFPAFGILDSERLKVDIPAVFEHVRALRDHFVSGVLEATSDLGDRNVAGRARLDGPNKLIVDGSVIEAKRIILAPGSSPVIPEPWQKFSDRILTSDTIFEQADMPACIGVVGLGPIGLELAQALARLGLEVHAFEGSKRIAGITDDEIAMALRAILDREMTIHLSAKVELKEADRCIEMSWPGGRVVVEKVIAAVGRKPNLDGLGLETLGIPLDGKGMPMVDPETMRIANTTVLLAGDANGSSPLLHEGADEGHIAGINATSNVPIRLARRTPLSIVFCTPEVAAVGKRAEELNQNEILLGEVSFANQGRARTMGANEGLLRVYADRTDGRVLGAEMAAPAGEHLGHLLALAIGQNLTVHDLLRMPFYHPTIEEGLRSALRAIARKLPPCSISDLAQCERLDAEALD